MAHASMGECLTQGRGIEAVGVLEPFLRNFRGVYPRHASCNRLERRSLSHHKSSRQWEDPKCAVCVGALCAINVAAFLVRVLCLVCASQRRWGSRLQYNYVEGGYARAEIDVLCDIDANLYGIGGSFTVTQWTKPLSR